MEWASIQRMGEAYGQLIMLDLDKNTPPTLEELDARINKSLPKVKPGDALHSGFAFMVAATSIVKQFRYAADFLNSLVPEMVPAPEADFGLTFHYPEGNTEEVSVEELYAMEGLRNWYPCHAQVSDTATKVHVYLEPMKDFVNA